MAEKPFIVKYQVWLYILGFVLLAAAVAAAVLGIIVNGAPHYTSAILAGLAIVVMIGGSIWLRAGNKSYLMAIAQERERGFYVTEGPTTKRAKKKAEKQEKRLEKQQQKNNR